MSNHVVSEVQMAFYFKIPGLKHMNVARSSRVIALDEKSPPRNPKLPFRLVAQFNHFLIEFVYPLDVVNFNQNVNDSFGASFWNGGAADVMDSYKFLD